jgi:hypothetical protein
MVSQVRDGIAETPATIRRRTQGNPLAAGVIAFGGGLLVGSLLPETKAEQKVARSLEPSVSGIAQQAGEIGKGVAEDVKATAAEAIEEVKGNAALAAENVKDEAKEAVTRARDEAQT